MNISVPASLPQEAASATQELQRFLTTGQISEALLQLVERPDFMSQLDLQGLSPLAVSPAESRGADGLLMASPQLAVAGEPEASFTPTRVADRFNPLPTLGQQFTADLLAPVDIASLLLTELPSTQIAEVVTPAQVHERQRQLINQEPQLAREALARELPQVLGQVGVSQVVTPFSARTDVLNSNVATAQVVADWLGLQHLTATQPRPLSGEITTLTRQLMQVAPATWQLNLAGEVKSEKGPLDIFSVTLDPSHVTATALSQAELEQWGKDRNAQAALSTLVDLAMNEQAQQRLAQHVVSLIDNRRMWNNYEYFRIDEDMEALMAKYSPQAVGKLLIGQQYAELMQNSNLSPKYRRDLDDVVNFAEQDLVLEALHRKGLISSREVRSLPELFPLTGERRPAVTTTASSNKEPQPRRPIGRLWRDPFLVVPVLANGALDKNTAANQIASLTPILRFPGQFQRFMPKVSEQMTRFRRSFPFPRLALAQELDESLKLIGMVGDISNLRAFLNVLNTNAHRQLVQLMNPEQDGEQVTLANLMCLGLMPLELTHNMVSSG